MQKHTWSRILFSLALPALAIPACVANDDEAEPIDEAEVVDVDEPTSSALVSPGATGFMPADYDGDRKADESWVSSGSGFIKIDNDNDENWDQTLRYPAPGDWRFFVPADYDGDGRADIAIKDRLGKWNIDYARNGFSNTWDESWAGYGAASIPVPADYDGDGRADLSVKDSGGTWYINFASNGFASGWDVSYSGYGPDSAVPVPADYDGDRRADLSVKDSYGYWHINYASNGFASGWDASYPGYGGSNARPAPADYDGDGKADLSVRDDASYLWHINYASNGFPAGWDAQFPGYGPGSSPPIPADYDGDGKADLSLAVQGKYWYVDVSSNGFHGFNWLDRMEVPTTPTITLEQATTTSLRVRFDGDGLTDEVVSGNNFDPVDNRRISGRTDTRTWTNLTPDTEYCFGMSAVNNEGFANKDRCFRTKGVPPMSGTNTVFLNRVVADGPFSYAGSWGPIPQLVATRLWTDPDPFGGTSVIKFLKPGYSNYDCNNPSATVLLPDGGSLDEAKIAEIQGVVWGPDSRYSFLACYASTGQTDVDVLTFHLDWRRVSQ